MLKITAQQKVDKLYQSTSVKAYNRVFNSLAKDTGYDKDMLISQWKRELKDYLRKRIYQIRNNAHPLLMTLVFWQKAAQVLKDYDTEYEVEFGKWTTVGQQQTSSSKQLHQQPEYQQETHTDNQTFAIVTAIFLPSPAQDPEMMDIDCTRNRKPDEQKYYNCQKTGHLIRNCPEPPHSCTQDTQPCQI